MPSLVQWLPCWLNCELADSFPAKRGKSLPRFIGYVSGGARDGCASNGRVGVSEASKVDEAVLYHATLVAGSRRPTGTLCH